MHRGFIGFIIGVIFTSSIITTMFLTGLLPVIKIAYVKNLKETSIESTSTNEGGYVKNEETAKKIAEAIWIPIYGSNVLNEKPYVAILNDGVWTVTGTMRANMVGGVAEIDISKADGKILRVIHGK